jgi:pyruvate dehydrogenase E1 component beta subunit
VAIPATPHDVKGVLLESIFGEDPTVIIEHRSLFSLASEVLETPYRVRFGKAFTRRKGADLTLVAIGMMVPMAMRVAKQLASEAIDIEVIDLCSASPIDTHTICASVEKTRRLMVADPTWRSVGLAAEIMACVTERLGSLLLAPPARLCFPDSHTPMSVSLEKEYYPDEERMASMIRRIIEAKSSLTPSAVGYSGAVEQPQ